MRKEAKEHQQLPRLRVACLCLLHQRCMSTSSRHPGRYRWLIPGERFALLTMWEREVEVEVFLLTGWVPRERRGQKLMWHCPVSNQRSQNKSKPREGLISEHSGNLRVWVNQFRSWGLNPKPSGKLRVVMWTFLKIICSCSNNFIINLADTTHKLMQITCFT